MSGCGVNGEGAITETKCETFSQFCHFNFQQILQYFELFVENTLRLAQKYAKIFVRELFVPKGEQFPGKEVREKLYITASLEEKIISKDNYMRIFSRPMVAIMIIILQYFSQQARSVSLSYVNKEK